MPTNANAIEAAIAIKIVMVKACAKSGEKVFNAYIIFTPFVLNCWLVMGWLARLGCSLCSSVVNRNEWGLPHRVVGCTIRTQNKGVKFFLNFFFRGVWALGCERLGVGARVWALGSVGGGGGMRMGGLDGGGIGMWLGVGRWMER